MVCSEPVDPRRHTVIKVVVNKGLPGQFVQWYPLVQPCKTVVWRSNDYDLLFSQNGDVSSGSRWPRADGNVGMSRFQLLDHRVGACELGKLRLYVGPL